MKPVTIYTMIVLSLVGIIVFCVLAASTTSQASASVNEDWIRIQSNQIVRRIWVNEFEDTRSGCRYFIVTNRAEIMELRDPNGRLYCDYDQADFMVTDSTDVLD